MKITVQDSMNTSNGSNLPNLWLYNYDFEFELAKKNRISFDKSTRFPWYFLNRSACLFLPMTSAEDAILVYETPSKIILDELQAKFASTPNFIQFTPIVESNSLTHDLKSASDILSKIQDRYRLAPWGWSESVIDFDRQCLRTGRQVVDFSIIQKTNSKGYSQYLREKDLPETFAIPSTNLTTNISLHELNEIVGRFYRKHSDFFIKHYHGTAGYLTDICSSEEISIRKIRKWKSWLKQAGGLLLEKKESVTREFSLQVDIDPGSQFRTLVLTRLLSSRDRHYQGTVIDNRNHELRDQLSSQLSPVLGELAQSGYIGPLGIDLLQTESGDFKLLEINARITMGRVAYEWHKTVNPHPIGLFSHIFIKNQVINPTASVLSKCNQLEKTSGCSITLISLTTLENIQITMAGFFIGANSEEKIWETVDGLKLCLYGD